MHSCYPTGKYKTQLFDNDRQEWLPSSPGIGMHVEVSSLLLVSLIKTK